jgi:hypothetical protein
MTHTPIIGRRDLLRGVGACAVAGALGPARLFAQDAPIRLGTGKHTYEWVKGWAKLPDGKSFTPTHGCVQVDSKDRVYVNTDNADAVIVFNPDGTFLKAWGKDISGGSAHGMCIVKEGDGEFAYVAHTGRHKIYKATLDGEVVMTIPWPESTGIYKGEGDYAPTMVSVAPNGDIYVAAGYGNPNRFIHRYDKAGTYVQSWNGEGTEGGSLNNVHGVWIDTRGKEPLVIAVDRGNGRLVHYTLDGKYVAVIAKGLAAPCKAYTQDGDVLIPNLGGGVTILGPDNAVAADFGANASDAFRGKFQVKPEDWKDGQFTAPHGACWDSKGDLYVEDWNAHGRVSKLKRI